MKKERSSSLGENDLKNQLSLSQRIQNESNFRSHLSHRNTIVIDPSRMIKEQKMSRLNQTFDM